MKDTAFSFTTALGSFLLVTFLTLTGCSPEPIAVMSIEGPDSLNVNETGTFTATLVNEEDQTQDIDLPVIYTWEWGGGAMVDGTLTEEEGSNTVSGEHAYSEAGEYTIEFVASTDPGEGEATGETSVVIVAPPEIVTINASSTSVETGQTVEFSANVQGTEPFSYTWEFGDGEVAYTEDPEHVYEIEGSNTVSLTVSNRAGSASRSLTINVEPALGACASISELNTIHFDFDESNIEPEAANLLDENINVLSDCPNMSVRIDAYTDHVGSDQYNLRLSERRARSVEDYYTANGVVASRLITRGLGQAPVPCLEEDPGPGCRQNRRAESIPMLQQ